jgi:hypothetical protein
VSEPLERPDHSGPQPAKGLLVKVSAPRQTPWLANAVLAVSALWGILALARAWLGTDPIQSPSGGTPVTADGFELLTVEVIRSTRNLSSACVWVLASILMDESYTAARYRGERLRFNRYWVGIGWALPVANFWLPKIFVDSLWAANTGSEADSRTRRRATAVWWPLWLVFLTGAFTLNNHPRSPLGQVDVVFWLRVLMTICLAPAYLAWWRVVRGLSAASRLPEPTALPVPPVPPGPPGR